MDDNIKEIRDNLINRTVGWKKVKVKIHMDAMVPTLHKCFNIYAINMFSEKSCDSR